MNKVNPVVLFDGVCNLCNSSINFIIDRDKSGYFKFAALQTDTGRQLLSQYNLPAQDYKSIVLIQNNRVYTKSTAILHLCKRMSGLWPLFYGFIILPKFLRDPLYDVVAKNRYDWFGKLDSCKIPTKELESRFI